MSSTRKAIVTAAIVTAAAALAACSSSSAPRSAPVPVTSAPAPANPVTVLRMTGATVSAGEVNGNVGLGGDRVASGTFPGGEDVYVFTYATQAALTSALAAHVPQDGETAVRGPGLSLLDIDATSSANVDSGGNVSVNYSYTVSPAVVAQRIKGKVIGQ